MTGSLGWARSVFERLRREPIPLALLLLLALALRLWALADVPPGWRDDELSNSLVISQHVLDGDLRLFYPDASGHEVLYHAVNALFLLLFGPGLWGIRLLSVLVGTGVVWLAFLLGRDLFGRQVAWIAAFGLATSFWSLIYSRIGQRHISAVFFGLAAFRFLWRALLPDARTAKPDRYYTNAVLAGLALGLGSYTYFGGRIPPFAVAGLMLYLLLFAPKSRQSDRERFGRQWKSLALTLVIAAALYVPLWHATRTTPGAEARVDELAVPIKALREGDWEPLLSHASVTLKMFHADGDDEWLYNVAHRPVFGPLGAVLFFAGLLLSMGRALPRRMGGRADSRHAFLLAWLASALIPGALAVPAASVSHTIIALPAAYLFPALALTEGARWLRRHGHRAPLVRYLPLAVGLLFLATESYRGLYDYFHYWPARGYVRLLHNADYHDVARFLNAQPDHGDVALGGALVEPWEQEALKVDLRGTWRVRWFDPRRALVDPAGGGSLVLTVFPKLEPTLLSLLDGDVRVQAKTFTVYDPPTIPLGDAMARFDNGLALHGPVSYHLDGTQLTMTTTWTVERPLDLPPQPLLSKPPPPGMSAGPRLAIFVHLLDANDVYVTGQDGLGVDPYTLEPGDRFVHLHRLSWTDEASHLERAEQLPRGYTVHIGLYDPRTGDRWRTDRGNDSLLLLAFQKDKP